MTQPSQTRIGSTRHDRFSARRATLVLFACVTGIIAGPLAAFGGVGEPDRPGADANGWRNGSPNVSHVTTDETMVIGDLLTSGELLTAEALVARGVLPRAVAVSGARLVDVSLGAAQGLRDSRGPIELRNVPVGGEVTEDFLLTPFEVFSDDAQVFRMVDGQAVPAPRPDVRFFKGRGITDTTSSLLLSVAGGRDVVMRVQSGGETTLINPIPSETRETQHMMVAGSALSGEPLGTLCSSGELPQHQEAMAAMTEEGEHAMARTGELIEAEIMVDINYGLIANAFGGDTDAASSYALNIVAASSGLYERDLSMSLKVSQLFYWAQPDPFSAASSQGQLQSYQQYCNNARGDQARDLAVLMADLADGGGIAYLDVVCNPQMGYAVTNMEINTTFPAQGYSWDLVVVTHELGHNFGSPHTHCYSPPIDRCNSECGHAVVPQVGTIMSYCHLLEGYGIEPYFHDRVRNQILGRVQNAACLTLTQGGNGGGGGGNGGGNGGGGGGNGNCDGQQDDSYEPNDNWDQVRVLQPGQHQLQGCNIDLFSVDVPTDSSVTVAISGAQGDLDLFLFSAQEQLAASTNENSNEGVEAELTAGTYYLSVEPYDGQGSAYTLRLHVQSLDGGPGNGGPGNDGPGNGGPGNGGPGNGGPGNGGQGNGGSGETDCEGMCGACAPMPGAGLVAGMFFLGGSMRRRRRPHRLSRGHEVGARSR